MQSIKYTSKIELGNVFDERLEKCECFQRVLARLKCHSCPAIIRNKTLSSADFQFENNRRVDFQSRVPVQVHTGLMRG